MVPTLVFLLATAAIDVAPADCALLPVERGGKTGYIDTTGHLVIPATFDRGGTFSEGLAAAAVDKKMGFIDCEGHWVIPPRFYWAQECREGWCRASEKFDDFGLYDRNGTRFPLRVLDVPFVPSEGIVVGIGSRHRYGFMDTKTGHVVGPRFQHANEFSEGVLGACESENHCGFVDRSGEWVIAPTYCCVSDFHEGLARVTTSQETVLYIDHAGKPKFSTVLTNGEDFADGVTGASRDGAHWGVLSRNGAFVVEPQFDFIGNHRDGRMLFMRGKRWGVIDYAGKVILDAIFERAELLPGGVIDVHLGNEHGYYDSSGRAIEGIRSLDAMRDIRRIALVAQEGHDPCGAFRVDVRSDGTATITSTCRARTKSAATDSPDPLHEAGRFVSANAGEVFAVLAKFVADNDLAHYDDRHTLEGLDTEYDAIEIETTAGTRSLSVAYGIAPSLQMMDWSLRQGLREMAWRRAED
jgi:hypothetical protein